jgi:hypothetical protein
MQIFIHHLDGNQTVVDTTDLQSVESLQQLLGLDARVNFVHEGSIMYDLESLKELSNVYITSLLEGGKKKKKKKKAYTQEGQDAHSFPLFRRQ